MDKAKPSPKPGDGKGHTTFRRYITLRNGRVLDAHTYGHKAWPIGSKKR